MENKVVKTKLLEACKSFQRKLIDNLKAEIESIQQSANDYGQQKDRYDSYRAQMTSRGNMFSVQLGKAMEELDVLDKIDPEKELGEVQFGTALVTNKKKVFVAIGCGKLNIEGEDWYAISVQVPYYEAVKGLKKGDHVNFRGMKENIVSVF